MVLVFSALLAKDPEDSESSSSSSPESSSDADPGDTPSHTPKPGSEDAVVVPEDAAGVKERATAQQLAAACAQGGHVNAVR